jgi:Putative adhesin
MGKRELLLVVCFLIVGVVVYQATAPTPAPGERGLSLGRLIEAAKREVGGNRAVADLTTTSSYALTGEITELRITGPISEVGVLGEDRSDVESTLSVNSRAYNDAEAKQYAQDSKLVADQTAAALILRMQFPTPGRQRSSLKLKVPKRLHIRIEPGSGTLEVKNVAAVEIAGTRGEVKLSQIAGRVQVSHRGGEVTIEDAGSLDFNGRAGSLKLTGVRGDTSIKMDGGGEISAANLAGSLDLESRNTDVTLQNLESTRGPIRINSIAGSVTMKGLKSEARIDVRNAEVKVAMTGAAPVAIYAENDRVSLTPPPGGFNLDALVIDGEITPAERLGQLGLRATHENDKEARVVGAVKGGGPTITVRSTRGDLELAAQDGKPGSEKAEAAAPQK